MAEGSVKIVIKVRGERGTTPSLQCSLMHTKHWISNEPLPAYLDRQASNDLCGVKERKYINEYKVSIQKEIASPIWV